MKPRPVFRALTVFLAYSLSGQVSVLTRHYDNARTGANLSETELTPSNVNKGHFGKLAERPVDGNIYTQPLIVAQARVTGRNTPVNVAIVATEHNSVYAFDADDVKPVSVTARLWHTGPEVLGAHVESAALYSELGAPGCADLTTEIGITGTPAIGVTRDAAPREGNVFVVSKAKLNGRYGYRLFALNLADGTKVGMVTIEGEVSGLGVGAGEDGIIHFDPRIQLNRPALLLAGKTLYVGFGGHCDRGPYHGWVFAYDVSDPKSPKRIGVFCSTPNGVGMRSESRAGIWMSGEGPSADEDGNIYFITGDGTNDGITDFGNSAVKLNLAGGKFEAAGWFAPENQELLKNKDVDLGSTGAVLLPDSHLIVHGSKDGRLFLLNRDRMNMLQSFQVTHSPDTRPDPPVFYNLHGMVIWPRAKDLFVYVSGEEDPVKQYRMVRDDAPGGSGWRFESNLPYRSSKVSAPYANFPNGLFGQAGRDSVWMPGGSLSLSANGTQDGTGILWVTMPFAVNANSRVVRGVLRAFDASDLSAPELWNSETTGNPGDRLGLYAKFCPPVVANGKVYVSAFQREIVQPNGIHSKARSGRPALVIYGLR